MNVKNFVDDTIPDWQMPDDGHHSVTIDAKIIYAPEMGRAAFDRSCRRFFSRRRSFVARLAKMRPKGATLYAIDEQAISAARDAGGEDYLDQFMFDTEKSATSEVGQVLSRAKRNGLLCFPENAREAVDVIPGRSFASDELRTVYQRGGRVRWTPSVRLSVSITFEGPRGVVEAAVGDLKAAMLFCGPVTSFTELAVAPSQRRTRLSNHTLVAV